MQNKKILFILSGIILIFIPLIIVFQKPEENTRTEANLMNHPLYETYQFDRNDSDINIGIQPLYLPTGIIFEILKRDNILNEALKHLGKKIHYYPFFKGADANNYLNQNLLDGVVGGDMPALSAASTTNIFIPIIIQKGNASVVSAKPSLTFDLKGKRIAYAYGSISHFLILDLLQSSGIRKDMVNLIPMDVSKMTAALHTNKIDIFSAWEPTVSESLIQYPNFFISYQKITKGYLYFTQSFHKTNPMVVKHIIASIIRAFLWVKQDQKNLTLACQWNITEIEKLTQKKSILTPEKMAAISSKDIFRFHSARSMIINDDELKPNGYLYGEYQFLNTVYPVKIDSNWQKIVSCFDNKLSEEVITQAKKFQLKEYHYNLN